MQCAAGDANFFCTRDAKVDSNNYETHPTSPKELKIQRSYRQGQELSRWKNNFKLGIHYFHLVKQFLKGIAALLPSPGRVENVLVSFLDPEDQEAADHHGQHHDTWKKNGLNVLNFTQ